MTDKTDFRKSLDSYQAKPGEFRILDVPDLRYLALDGHGDPNSSPAYAASIQTLYPVAYKLKFASKRDLGRDYVVPPLEGLWWADDPAAFTTARDKSQWDWTLLSMVPDWASDDLVLSALAQAGAKNPPPLLGKLRLESLSEGRCVQTLHIGSYDDEGPVLARMHASFLPEQGLRPHGKHHEIYFSDPRKVAPGKLRTILRQPIAPAM
jgi:hypothetical protein